MPRGVPEHRRLGRCRRGAGAGVEGAGRQGLRGRTGRRQRGTPRWRHAGPCRLAVTVGPPVGGCHHEHACFPDRAHAGDLPHPAASRSALYCVQRAHRAPVCGQLRRSHGPAGNGAGCVAPRQPVLDGPTLEAARETAATGIRRRDSRGYRPQATEVRGSTASLSHKLCCVV